MQLHNRDDVEKLIDDHRTDHKLIVLDVGLKHCGPCVKVYPTVLKLSKQMADTAVFARMNGDENDSRMQFLNDMEVVELQASLSTRHSDILWALCRAGPGRSGRWEIIGGSSYLQGVRITFNRVLMRLRRGSKKIKK